MTTIEKPTYEALQRRVDELEFQANLLDKVGQAVIVCDRDGIITYWNSAAEELYQWTRAEALGRRIMETTVPQISQSEGAEIMGRLTRGEPWEGEFDVTRKDGTVFPAHVCDTPIIDDSGLLQGIVGITTDITELIESRRQAATDLAEKKTLLRELYHRTKNNMQVILSMLTLEAAYQEDDVVVEMLRGIENRIHSMALVHQKLYHSQSLSEIHLLEYTTELGSLILESYGLTPGVDVTITHHVDDITVLIDSAIPCGLILTELISNSVKHAFHGVPSKAIEIHIHRDEERELEIRYADNGVGLPPDLDLGSSPSLGIQLLRSIVEHQLKGRVSFSGDDGFQCRITFRDELYEPRV